MSTQNESTSQVSELQKIMFEQLKRLNDPNNDLDKELKRSNAIKDLGTVMVNSAKVQLDYVRVTKLLKAKDGDQKKLVNGQ